MKKLALIAAIVFVCVSLFAQPPQAFKYQAVARTTTGNLIQNQLVAFRISLLQGSPSGTLTYQERHALNTNDYGLASLEIGNGTVLAGAFSSIDWSAGQMFIKVELDPLGGTAYQNMGTAQLLSVPYALYSERSMDSPWLNGSTGIYYNDANVGIGTNNPLNKLEVNGTTLIGNETKGLRLRNNGAVVDIESVGTDLAINYQEGGNTVLNVDAGNVGIGELSPAYKLHVRSFASGTWLSGFHNTSTSSSSNGVVIRADGGDPLWIQNNLTTLLAVKNNGNVGIGTTAPQTSLHVNGAGLFKSGDGGVIIGSMGTSGAVNYSGISGGYNNITLNWAKTTFTGNVGIGTLSPNRELEINGGNAEDGLRVAWGSTYPTVYGELLHGGSGGFKLNAEAGGGGWADMSFQTNGNTRMFIESAGKVGIGTTTPTAALEVYLSSGFAIYGHSAGSTGIWGASTTSYGVFGQSTSGYAGYFSGPVHVTGTLSKGAGSFVIDHPLDPENKLLRHNFVESPENLLIYRGKVLLDENGETMVQLPDYFEALTKEDQATVTLTSIGKPFMTGYEWSGDFKAFKIYGESVREVSWVVYADRDDPVIHELGRPVEEEKGGDHSLCEKGKLLYPKAYGYPETSGRDYEMLKEQNKD